MKTKLSKLGTSPRFKQFYPYKKNQSILWNCEIKFIDGGIKVTMLGSKGFDIQGNTFHGCKLIELDNGFKLLKEE